MAVCTSLSDRAEKLTIEMVGNGIEILLFQYQVTGRYKVARIWNGGTRIKYAHRTKTVTQLGSVANRVLGLISVCRNTVNMVFFVSQRSVICLFATEPDIFRINVPARVSWTPGNSSMRLPSWGPICGWRANPLLRCKGWRGCRRIGGWRGLGLVGLDWAIFFREKSSKCVKIWF